MLASSHLVTGAAIAIVVQDPVPRTAAVLASHVVLDFIGHDDHTVGPLLQATLGFGALAAVAWGWGPRSPVVLGGLTAAAPDAEVAVGLFTGHRSGPFVFPSHWQIGPRRGSHPVRFPLPGLVIGVEVALMTAGAVAVAAAGRRARDIRRLRRF